MTDATLRDPVGVPGRRKVGRPARLDREMIAQAASEVGLDQVTMKAVADRPAILDLVPSRRGAAVIPLHA